MQNLNNYINQLSYNSPIIESELARFKLYWGDAADELHIVLFASIANTIINNIDKISDSEIIRVFDLIEIGTLSVDDKIKYAAISGFIHGIVTYSDNDPDLWKQLFVYFGDESKKYALEWKYFGQALKIDK